MMKSKLLPRYVLYGLGISLIFLILAQLTTRWLVQISEAERRRVGGGPFATVQVLLNSLPPSERAGALREVLDADPRDRIARELVLVDTNDQILFSARSASELEGDTPDRVMDLKGEPRQRLKVFARARPAGPRERGPPPGPPGGFWHVYSVQAAALIGAVLLTVFILITTLRGKAQIAEGIIQELARGNLKARFPVSRMDEVGQVMFSFNKMADEIEHLIEHLRKVESVRRDLLRELAHDLRTPIASMKSLIETAASDKLSDEKRREVLDLALREADYFAGLVDDLLFLGRVAEPRYKSDVVDIDIAELVRFEIETIAATKPEIQIKTESPPRVTFQGDPDLLRRLVRNALQNATSFARREVRVVVREEESVLRISIEDDGQGFSESAIATFGSKKFSRTVAENHEGRISIGLGSVIMKSVTDAYRGRIEVGNRKSSTGDVLGAQVSITLPRA